MSRPPSKARAMAPPPRRPTSSLLRTGTPSLNGRSSPAESHASMRIRSPPVGAGMKRKERDFDTESVADNETNINVVVRCRGRSDREVRENSGVVVSTDGVRGKTVDLSMGPSALSNKSYHFDKVFSPAADQIMIFDEVVVPILDEVLRGFNCTIFAYGQTGTGKTFTMSGDISDQSPLPENAGIIPRVLHALFGKLDSLPNSPNSGAAPENNVKVSFIELYNEELRDLLSADDSAKLKIYDGDGKRGHAATLVQGMEESHITSANKGIQLLREGSYKRQVAATKCNDLSSRSHSVFTVTVHTKRTTESGEEVVSTGKLNLVDLAGSENIGRSGAENKRAAEAGLINKSLLTLGRVINALVDKSSHKGSQHIPYRESKLTRLLQDSLGGETKTCIIATLSPAKSNLEETISTLDYAFRAKNIRNKPQVNHIISKKTLLREFTVEIEKLKSDLIATRHRNGVYLTQETYDEITTESESRRILANEQRDKIETQECNLRNKIQELYSLTTSFKTLKDDSEATKLILDNTKGLLEKTEIVLQYTKKSLEEEVYIREQLEKTERQLESVGKDLLTTLGQTTADIGGLHSKLRRRSNLQSVQRQHWSDNQTQVSQVTSLVEDRLQEFQEEQQAMVNNLSSRMQSFVQDELVKLQDAKAELQEKSVSFDKSHAEVTSQTVQSRDELNSVLDEIKSLREDVKQKVGLGLNDLGVASQRISAGIMTEIEAFHSQLHNSYAAIGREFKLTFDDLLGAVSEQRGEIDSLRKQIANANAELSRKNDSSFNQFQTYVDQEKSIREQENQDMMSRIQQLVQETAKQQEFRMQQISGLPTQLRKDSEIHRNANSHFMSESGQWVERSKTFGGKIVLSRDGIKSRIQADFAAASKHTADLRAITSSVHDETTRIVEEQVRHLDTELHSLDDIVERIQQQNNSHHASHEASLTQLASTVQSSYLSIDSALSTSFNRVESLDTDMSEATTSLQETLPSLAADAHIRRPLSDLREQIEADKLEEYAATGLTPARKQYEYPTSLPRTDGREELLDRLRNGTRVVQESHAPRIGSKSPSKGLVFADLPSAELGVLNSRPGTASSTATALSLREIDPNTLSNPAPSADFVAALPSDTEKLHLPTMKRFNSTATRGQQGKKRGVAGVRKTVAGNALLAERLADRENVTMPNLSASVGAGAVHPGTGRRLRSHERNGP